MEFSPLTINLGDGVERPIEFSIARAKQLEAEYADKGGLFAQPVENVPALILEGLVDKGDLTVEEIQSMCSMQRLTYIFPILLGALNGSDPDDIREQLRNHVKNVMSSQVKALQSA